MANLAINGHKTRGSEVIALLEMLGGKNIYNLTGTKEIWYILSDGTIKHSTCIFDDKGFALEEFLEKFPYKVGDKVMTDDGDKANIVGMVWDNDKDDVFYEIQIGIEAVKYPKELLQPYKEETMDRKYNVEEYLKVWKETEKGLEVVVNDNFELKEYNEKFYIIKKQLQYPKTYVDCCEVLGSDPSRIIVLSNRKDIIHEENKHCFVMYNLYQLLICRDAYWKIAGKQMRLGKPWKPDWLNAEQDKYVLFTHNNAICSNRYVLGHYILAFPTEDMRDAFYENFKELIENVKELL